MSGLVMSPHLRKLLETNPLGTDVALLLLRLWFGTTLALAHGLGKVSDLGGFSSKIANRVPFAEVLGPAAGLSEFLGGLLFALGLFTRPAAFLMFTTMMVAGFHIHSADPFGKKELAFAFGLAALAVLVAGPGKLSVDQWILSRFGRR
jgi:putative oxidoreductase